MARGDTATPSKSKTGEPDAGRTSAHDASHRGATEDEERHRLSLLFLTVLALALGVVTGLGAVLFRDLIGLLHNLFFNGSFTVDYDANVFTAPSRWGALVILAPVIGAVLVTFLVNNFAPEAKGHGVPEVMDAIYYREGKFDRSWRWSSRWLQPLP
ncbi:hypothetical protein ACVDG5_008715 [Mesorhizobium sp. ORM6]